MKKYLIDTNMASDFILSKCASRNDCFMLDVILQEVGKEDKDLERLKQCNIKIIDLEIEHYQMLKTVLLDHGNNFDLIRCWTDQGSGDVLQLAFILAEYQKEQGFFPDEWIIITQDDALIQVASTYKIECLEDII